MSETQIFGSSMLVHDDCLHAMGSIPAKSIDMVLCDLPYGVLNKANKNAQWDVVIPFQELWTHYRRVCKDRAAIILFASGMFTADLMESNKSWWRYNLIWDKINPTAFLNCNRMPLRSHEDICVFYKKLPAYHPQMEVYEGKRHGKGSKWLSQDKDSGSNCYGSYSQLPTIMRTERYPVSIIRVKRKHDISHHYHPTEKPVELLRWLIKTYTNPGDVVLDNTMGSGSTCFAALLEDRRFIGIEKEKQYYDIAVERLQSAVSDKELKND